MKSSLAARSPGNIFDDGVFLLALKEYFDGSVTEGKFMTFTCVAADESVWSELEPAWRDVCVKRGNPAYVHMTDLMALEGIYKNWTADQRDVLIDGLVGILMDFSDKKPKLHSFTCSVNLEAYERWKQIKHHPAPERLCARIVFPQVLDWFWESPDKILDAIDAFFDQGERFMRHIRADWVSKKKRKDYPVWSLIRTIESADMKLTPALQIADLVCWGRQRLVNGSGWETDDWYATAMRCAHSLVGKYTPIDENVLANSTFPEEGQAAIELWSPKRVISVRNPSEEYKKFDAMMRRLMLTSHDDIKAKLDAEKAAKKRSAKKKSSASRAPGASRHGSDDS